MGRDKVNYKLRDWVFSRHVTGVSPSPWCTATSAAGSSCPREQPALDPSPDNITDFEPGLTAIPAGPPQGLGQDHLPLLRRPRYPRD